MAFVPDHCSSAASPVVIPPQPVDLRLGAPCSCVNNDLIPGVVGPGEPGRARDIGDCRNCQMGLALGRQDVVIAKGPNHPILPKVVGLRARP